jgi:hypothetical protein
MAVSVKRVGPLLRQAAVACAALFVTAACMQPSLTIDQVGNLLLGSWQCPGVGELVIADLGHYFVADSSEWGHFLIDLQGEITFREDGPLRNQSGRLDLESRRLSSDHLPRRAPVSG